MLINAENICKSYTWGTISSQRREVLQGVSISVDSEESVTLIGPSGSGKSTLGLILAGLLPYSSGRILYHGKEIQYPYTGEIRRHIQVLFQNPELSFNPKLPIIKSFKETYRHIGTSCELKKLLEYLYPFGIYEEHIYRRPSTLSGGELQRLALARILLMNPELLILDEPTSMLDTISQAQMIGLLREIQSVRRISYLFISHDLPLAKIFCNRFIK